MMKCGSRVINKLFKKRCKNQVRNSQKRGAHGIPEKGVAGGNHLVCVF